jgi:hypothetical protein
MNDTPHLLETREEREKALALDRKRILAMTPEKALEAIADHPYPVTLVQSLAEEDFYLLVHTIGPDDALPILSLASNDQWEYLLDTDTWSRDRIDLHAVTQWMGRLLKADDDRFTHWITRDKVDDLRFYFFHNLDVVVREHDQDPSDLGEGFSSEDNVHFVRLRKLQHFLEKGKQAEEDRDTLVTDLLRRISVFDYPAYVGLLLESTSVLPAEEEEELLRRRNIRQAEKGFIPYEEAVGVYQPLTVKELFHRNRKSGIPQGRCLDAYPLPVAPENPPEDANLFARTLVQIQDTPSIDRLQTEFAGLCNQVIVADQLQIRDKETLKKVVTKVSDIISIGLEHIDTQRNEPVPYANATLIQTYLLGDLFRVGYGCAMRIKWKADRWRQSAWFTKSGLPLGFWGEAGLGVLGGLLLKRPLYFDNYARGTLYREFAVLSEIKQTEELLEEIIAFDDLLALMAVRVGGAGTYGFLTFQNLLLTLWANHYLKMSADDDTPHPLTMEQFRSLFRVLWKSRKPNPEINIAVREDFLAWLAGRSHLDATNISQRMGAALERLFKTIESELGSVAERYLDPRHIHLFLFKE